MRLEHQHRYHLLTLMKIYFIATFLQQKYIVYFYLVVNYLLHLLFYLVVVYFLVYYFIYDICLLTF